MAPRDNRVKEYRFPEQNITAANSGLFLYSDYAINGEIQQVESSFSQNGSLALTPSGLTNQEIWRRNASSGADTIIAYPAHFTESTTGSIANAQHVPFVINEELALTTGSLTSGTVPLSVVIKYI